jgi:hypothetical protein
MQVQPAAYQNSDCISQDKERAIEFQQSTNSLQATSRQLEVSQHYFSAQPKSRQRVLLAMTTHTVIRPKQGSVMTFRDFEKRCGCTCCGKSCFCEEGLCERKENSE